MAPSLEDCDKIIEAARQGGGKFMVGHVCRFDPRVTLAKQAIDEGRVGKIISTHARRNLSKAIGLQVCGSISALFGDGIHDAVYGASKAAVVALMRSLVTDHGPSGIRFAGVSPGTIDTPMLAASCEGFDKPKDELYAEVARKIPVQRMGMPEDVAHTVAFLISDAAGFVNGAVIPVEGGTLCLPPW